MTGLTPRVFVDFDGTITKVDVGDMFFRKFGNEEDSLKAVEKWKDGNSENGIRKNAQENERHNDIERIQEKQLEKISCLERPHLCWGDY